jgi:hypothetical protein
MTESEIESFEKLCDLLMYFEDQISQPYSDEFAKHFVYQDEKGTWLVMKENENLDLIRESIDRLDSSIRQDALRRIELDELCSAVLIGSDGRCNWANHRRLEKRGFRVVAGEKDSFGWLSGVVISKSYRVVYF